MSSDEWHYYSGKARVSASVDVAFEVLIPTNATKDEADRLIAAAARNAAADEMPGSVDDFEVNAYEYSRGPTYIQEKLEHNE